jgi:bifunctional ADP-heptose synthase (sugar kinase/adenylyltransferase)
VVLTRAGVWRAKASILLGPRGDYLTYGMCIARNGVNLPTFERWQPGTSSAQRTCTVTTTALYAAGDSITAIAFQANTAAAAVSTAIGSSFESSFEVEFLRDA